MRQYEHKEEAAIGGGIPAPPKGWYRVSIGDGIKVYKKEGKDHDSVMVPLVVIADGEPFDGHKSNLFLSRSPKALEYSEQNMYNILEWTGLLDKFEKHFPGDVSPLEDKVVEQLALRLPDKAIEAELTPQADNANFSNITAMRKLGAGKSAPGSNGAKGAKKSAPAPEPVEQEDGGWE